MYRLLAKRENTAQQTKHTELQLEFTEEHSIHFAIEFDARDIK
jgi:hypothetical protein